MNSALMRWHFGVVFTIWGILIGALAAAAAVSPNANSPPEIASVTSPILVGDSFVITGSGFTTGSRINLFVATSTGAINKGPLIPSAVSASMLVVPVPVTVPQGSGVAAVQVVNVDSQGNPVTQPSNVVTVLLQGSSAHGFPSITSINGTALAADSTDPGIATANVETVIAPGKTVTIGGTGFDTTNGVAVNLFCACSGGKVGPFFLNPGDPGLSATSVSFVVPSSGANAPVFGPGSFVVINKGADGSYSHASAAVSVAIGEKVTIASISQQGHVVTVTGTGFSKLTVINFFNLQNGAVFNLKSIPLTCPVGTNPIYCNVPLNVVSPHQFEFLVPPGVMTGPAYVQAINPPFTPFTSSENNGSLSVNAPPVYAYVLNESGPGQIRAFSVSQSALTPGKLAPTGIPLTVGPPASAFLAGVLVDPANRYVYVTDQADGTVAAFAIQQTGANPGAPVPDGAPVPTGSGAASQPNRMAANPDGRFLYVANVGDGTISAFSIVQSGADAGQLVPDGPPVTTGSMPQYLSVDPSGKYLYVTNADSMVWAYTIVQSGSNAGQLAKNGVPISVASPAGIAVDPGSRYAYVASDVSPGTLLPFRIVQSGATAGQLVPNGPAVPISSFTPRTPADVVVDPMGLYVIVSGSGFIGGGGGILSITQTGPNAGQVTNQNLGGSPVAPFALGGGNLGFYAQPIGRFVTPELSDYWAAGGNMPSFVFETLDTFIEPVDAPTAVAATN